jgi:hypothetical protein
MCQGHEEDLLSLSKKYNHVNFCSGNATKTNEYLPEQTNQGNEFNMQGGHMAA